jgi:choline dehydrogenase-like flavoprotein
MWDNSIDTLTFRNFANEQALPIRRIGAFLPGEGVGGSGIHWGALHWRFLPSDFRIRSALAERYGAGAIPADMTIQDWPLSYDEVEPFYNRFDKTCGTSGKAGNLRGRKVEGGNEFEGPRNDEYPNAPIKSSNAGLMFAAAAKSLGYHPFPAPVAIASSAYANPEGVTLGGCEYCGFCNRIACETNAKASPNSTILPTLRLDPKFEMRTRCFVTKLNYDGSAKRVARRHLYGHAGRSGIRAACRDCDLVILCFQQRAAPLTRRHRRALRSGERQGRGRQKLRLPVRSRRHCVLRRQGAQSVLGLGGNGGLHRRLQWREFRPRRAWLLRWRLFLQ